MPNIQPPRAPGYGKLIAAVVVLVLIAAGGAAFYFLRAH